MTTTAPDIGKGVFGLAENDLPPGGITRTAVWPVIESAPGRNLGTTITGVRRQLAWWTMRRHAATIVQLNLVNPPKWAAKSIAKRRSSAGLTAATVIR